MPKGAAAALDELDVDYSKLKGVADEAHFNDFVVSVGGELVGPLVRKPGVKNADYLFRADGVVGEHKILETDFAQSTETEARVEAAFAKYRDEDLTDRRHPLYRELFSILRVPIRRIVEKANKQIKETKLHLSLADHRGVVFLVNDSFRSAPPGLVLDLIKSIAAEKERYRSVDAIIYLTNHYVEIAENDLANLLWTPTYKGYPSDRLTDFIDRLGWQWGDFMETHIGPFAGRSAGPNPPDWDRAYVVKSNRRQQRFVGTPTSPDQPS